MPYLGEIAALVTALCWLGSSLAFAVAGREAGAQSLNQFRLYAALPLLFVLGFALVGKGWPSDASLERISLIGVSGILGLVIGDYGFFHALATIGPRLATVIMSLWPACTVAINLLRGEDPTSGQLLGVGVTVAGVAMVLLGKREGAWRPNLTASQWLWGCVGALVGALGQASGFVMAGIAMEKGADLPSGVDPLLATIVRMCAATIGMQLIVCLQGRPLAMTKIVRNKKALVAAMIGVVCGPVLGVWMSMVGAARAVNTGVASALMATTPIFMLPVAMWFYKARVGPLGILGTILAVAGVAICFLQAA
ncbi:MAG TPA: DMT family transporter [Planctomycetes bacterium]|nr:DMT family transporter [Planctomycetota bacterium]